MAEYLLDVVIEAETDCELVRSLERILGLDILDVRRRGEQLVRHLVSIPHTQLTKLKSLALNLGFKLESTNVFDNQCFATVTTRSCTPCRIITGSGAFMVSGRLSGFRFMEYRFISDEVSFKKVIKAFSSLGIRYSIKKVTRYRSKGILTEVQERALLIALKSGFFDYPRKVTLEELARSIGVSPSTLSEILRRGLKRLVEYYYEEISSIT